jgi:hypothetical protein
MVWLFLSVRPISGLIFQKKKKIINTIYLEEKTNSGKVWLIKKMYQPYHSSKNPRFEPQFSTCRK